MKKVRGQGPPGGVPGCYFCLCQRSANGYGANGYGADYQGRAWSGLVKRPWKLGRSKGFCGGLDVPGILGTEGCVPRRMIQKSGLKVTGFIHLMSISWRGLRSQEAESGIRSTTACWGHSVCYGARKTPTRNSPRCARLR